MATAVDLKKQSTGAKRSTAQQRSSAKSPGPSPVKRGKAIMIRIMARPGVKHLQRAAKRFSERLGSQFAGAITYFSFLSLVPILLVSFSVAGFVLNSHPDLLVKLQDKIASQIPGSLHDTISTAIDHAVKDRYSVLSVGLVIALYSGIGWMGNVRQAVQAQWRPDFDDDQEIANTSFIKNLIKNLWMLVGLGLALLVSLILSSVGGALAGKIPGWIGLGDVGWLSPVITVVSLLLAVGADMLIFLWVYTVLPPDGMKAPRAALVRGSVIAAIGFEALKLALTKVPSLFSGGSAGAVFGPVIGLLAFFNLVATLVLFVAAWIATSPGGPGKEKNLDDYPEVAEPAVVVHEMVSKPRIAGLVGVGALLGWGYSRRRRG